METGEYYANVQLTNGLFRVSGWVDTRYQLVKYSMRSEPMLLPMPNGALDVAVLSGDVEWKLPAYNLGYLLRKLSRSKFWKSGTTSCDIEACGQQWQVRVDGMVQPEDAPVQSRSVYSGYADTPEDAAASLAIKLFEQGVITQ